MSLGSIGPEPQLTARWPEVDEVWATPEDIMLACELSALATGFSDLTKTPRGDDPETIDIHCNARKYRRGGKVYNRCSKLLVTIRRDASGWKVTTSNREEQIRDGTCETVGNIHRHGRLSAGMDPFPSHDRISIALGDKITLAGSLNQCEASLRTTARRDDGRHLLVRCEGGDPRRFVFSCAQSGSCAFEVVWEKVSQIREWKCTKMARHSEDCERQPPMPVDPRLDFLLKQFSPVVLFPEGRPDDCQEEQFSPEPAIKVEEGVTSNTLATPTNFEFTFDFPPADHDHSAVLIVDDLESTANTPPSTTRDIPENPPTSSIQHSGDTTPVGEKATPGIQHTSDTTPVVEPTSDTTPVGENSTPSIEHTSDTTSVGTELPNSSTDSPAPSSTGSSLLISPASPERGSQIPRDEGTAAPAGKAELTFQTRHSPEALQSFLATLTDSVDLETLVDPSSSGRPSVVRYLSIEHFTPDSLQRECKESLELIFEAMRGADVPLAGRLAFRRVMQNKFGSRAGANKRAANGVGEESTRQLRPRR